MVVNLNTHTGKIQGGKGSYRFLCLRSINLKISNAILHVRLHKQIPCLYLFFWVSLINLPSHLLYEKPLEGRG